MRTAPPLIPIYAHCFLTTHEDSGPRAVLVVWQATDSIFHGYDMADYFTREFMVDQPHWTAQDAPAVPVWEDLFDLFCEGERNERR